MDLVICEPNLDSPGGRQRVILEIAKKYNPIIYTYAYKKEGTLPGFKEFDIRVPKELKLNSTFTIKTGKAFLSLKLQNYDVINAHWGPSQWVRNKNERVLWYCHSPIRAVYDLYAFRHRSYPFYLKPFHAGFAKWYQTKNIEIVKKIETVVCNSNNTKQRLQQYLKKPAGIVHPGVELQNYSNNSYEKYFLLPTRICPTKRLEYGIHAFNIFKKTHPDWKLKIIGSLHPKDTAYYHKIKKLHPDIQLDLPDEKWYAMYSNCTAMLFTSMNEDFGIIPLEGMASEKPVISVNEGGPKETIINNETGYLVNSPEEMAEKMAYLADNPDVVERMGKNGRARVKANFTWDVFLREFDKHLRKL